MSLSTTPNEMHRLLKLLHTAELVDDKLSSSGAENERRLTWNRNQATAPFPRRPTHSLQGRHTGDSSLVHAADALRLLGPPQPDGSPALPTAAAAPAPPLMLTAA